MKTVLSFLIIMSTLMIGNYEYAKASLPTGITKVIQNDYKDDGKLNGSYLGNNLGNILLITLIFGAGCTFFYAIQEKK